MDNSAPVTEEILVNNIIKDIKAKNHPYPKLIAGDNPSCP